MKTKYPKKWQPLSRWKKIIIHDENNKIIKIHDLDENEKLINHIKNPKRKINYRRTLEKEFNEYIQSKDFMKRPRINKKNTNCSTYSNEKEKNQLEKLFKSINKTKKRSENKGSVLKNNDNDQKMSLLSKSDDISSENREMPMEKCSQKKE